MTNSQSHTALAWREMADAPKDQELLVKGGHYQVAAETYPEWYEAKGVALVQWREHDGWRGEMCDGDYIWHRPTHFITVADLLAQSGTEPPQSLNTELLEAAKALGAMPEGYCFCSNARIGDDSKIHEPECRDLRTAVARAETV